MNAGPIKSLKKKILAHLKQRPGATDAELCRKFLVPMHLISLNLARLVTDGDIIRVGVGTNEARSYPVRVSATLRIIRKRPSWTLETIRQITGQPIPELKAALDQLIHLGAVKVADVNGVPTYSPATKDT